MEGLGENVKKLLLAGVGGNYGREVKRNSG